MLLLSAVLWAVDGYFFFSSSSQQLEVPLLLNVTLTISNRLQFLICFSLGFIASLSLNSFNHRYSIIRERTTLMGSLFMLIYSALPFLHRQPIPVLTFLLVLWAVYAIFSCYTSSKPQRPVYWAFLLVALASFLFPQILYFAPIFYFGVWQSQTFTFRSFFAGLLGLATPYWFLLSYSLLFNDISVFLFPFQSLVQFHTFNIQEITSLQWMSLAFLVLFVLPAFVHFFFTLYINSIQSRKHLVFLLVLELTFFFFLCLQPFYFDVMYMLQLLGFSFMFVRFVVVSKTRLTNILFLFSFIILLMLALFMLWKDFFNFV